ncbi:MAG: GRB10 interacting GYF protein 1 [Marteilia pararefringens]
MPVISPPIIEHPKPANAQILGDTAVKQTDVTRSQPIIEHSDEMDEQQEIVTRPLSPNTSHSPLQNRAHTSKDSDEVRDQNSPISKSSIGSVQEASDKWYYIDPKKQIQGPFASSIMQKWYIQGFFPDTMMIRNEFSETFTKFSDLLLNGNPFVIQSKKLQKFPKFAHKYPQSNGTKINKESTVDIQKLKISSWKKVPEAQSSNAKSKSVDQVSREIDQQQQQLKYANKLRYQQEKKLTYFDRAFLKR